MLKELKLTNFKSFREASLKFGPFTLIVGANASGKSNLRDALRFLHGIGLGYTIPEILDGKNQAGKLQWEGIRGGVLDIVHSGKENFSLDVTVEDLDDLYEFNLEEKHFKLTKSIIPKLVSEELRINGELCFKTKINGSIEQTDSSYKIETEDPDYSALTIDFFRNSSLYLWGKNQWENEFISSKSKTVLTLLQSLRFLDLHPDAMREASSPGVNVLGDRGENLSSVILSILEDESRKEVLTSWIRSLTPMDVVDFDFKFDFQGRVLAYLKEANGLETSLISASDGTLRFLALVAALLSPDTGKLYFFEEFDNGIHPTRLGLLLNLVEQACKEQGIQVVATTHNPALLTLLSPEAREHAVLAIRPEDSTESHLIRIMDLPHIHEVLEQEDLGYLHFSGWLENTAEFWLSDLNEQALENVGE